jgi:chorismate synthase
MNAKQYVKPGSSIEQQLRSVNMSNGLRLEALHDCCIAEAFVGAVEWICGKFTSPGPEVFGNPGAKYR